VLLLELSLYIQGPSTSATLGNYVVIGIYSVIRRVHAEELSGPHKDSMFASLGSGLTIITPRVIVMIRAKGAPVVTLTAARCYLGILHIAEKLSAQDKPCRPHSYIPCLILAHIRNPYWQLVARFPRSPHTLARSQPRGDGASSQQ